MRAPDVKSIAVLDPTGLFTIREAARLLGYSYEGLRRRVVSDKVKSVKRGKVYFIRGAYIQQQLEMDEGLF